MSSRRARKRRQRQRRQNAKPRDDGMRQATLAFTDGIHGLIDPQPHPQAGVLPCRYTTLRQALYNHHGGNGNHARAHSIPASIDALKYVTEIDGLALTLVREYPAHYCQIADKGAHRTIQALAGVLTHRWHREDKLEQIRDHTTLLVSYAQKIDDLFAPKPLYLPNPCPHCGHTHAHKTNDEGEPVSVPALALTVEHGATCNQCHDNWTPDQLQWLAKLLGYQPLQGVLTISQPQTTGL